METVPGNVTVTFEGVQVEETTTRRIGCVRVVVSGLPDGLLVHLPAQALQSLLLNTFASQPQATQQVERTVVTAPGASAPVPVAAPVAAPAPVQPEPSQPVTPKVIELDSDELTRIAAKAAAEDDAQRAAAAEPVPAPIAATTEVPAPTPVPPVTPELAPLVEIGGYKCRRCSECGVLFVPFSTLVHGGEGPGKTPAVLRCPRHQRLTHLEGFKLQRAGFEFGFRPVAIDGQEVLIIAPAKAEPVRPSTTGSTIRPTPPAKQMPPVANLRPRSMWVRYTNDPSDCTYFKARKCEYRERRLDADGKLDGDKLCGDWFQVEPEVDGDARCCPAHLPDEARDRIASNMMRHARKYARDYVKVTERDGTEHSLYLYRFVRVEQEETAAYWAAEDARSKALRDARRARAELASARESNLSFKDKRIAIFEANLRIAYIENGYKLPSSMPDFEGSLRLADPMSQQEVETAMARVVVCGILEGGIRVDTNFPGFYSPEHAASYAALKARKATGARRDGLRARLAHGEAIKAPEKAPAAPVKARPDSVRSLADLGKLNIVVAPAPASSADQPSEAPPTTVIAPVEETSIPASEEAQPTDQPTDQPAEEPVETSVPTAVQTEEVLATEQSEHVPPPPAPAAETETAHPADPPADQPTETPAPVTVQAEEAPVATPEAQQSADPPAKRPAPGSEEVPPPAPADLADLSANGHNGEELLETVIVTVAPVAEQ